MKKASKKTSTKSTSKASPDKTTSAAKTSAAKKSARKKTASKSKSKPSESVAHGLSELFEDMLKDIYWAEKALTKAIPKMVKKATSETLVNALKSHLEETHTQIGRCEQVFEILRKKAQAKKCEAMDGLIKEAQEIMETTEDGPVRDAGIIAAGQKVEHYEIASYGTMCAFARILGHIDIVELLEETLSEEKQADEKLTEVAESAINIEAAEEDDE